jgi:hypothetical protein
MGVAQRFSNEKSCIISKGFSVAMCVGGLHACHAYEAGQFAWLEQNSSSRPSDLGNRIKYLKNSASAEWR